MEAFISAPSCINLIIRLNCANTSDEATNPGDNLFSPFDYFSYINTKSRAKSKNASCYFFIEKNHFDSFFTQFVRCKQIEQVLIKNYSKLIALNKAFIGPSNSDEEKTPKLSTNKSSESLGNERNTVLSLEASIRIINKYCIRLPSDALTQLTPRCLTLSRGDAYKCLIYLPINSGIHEPIESGWEASVEIAKTSAAYNTCLHLFRSKELNEWLEPITKEIFYRLNHQSDADDEREWSQFSSYFQKHQQQLNSQHVLNTQNLQQQISNYMSHRPGGNKRKQIYAKRVSPYLKSLQAVSTQAPVYLYVFECNVTVPLPTVMEGAAYTGDGWCFGMVTSKIILETSDFPIFTQNGEETVNFPTNKNFIIFILNTMLRRPYL